MARILVLEDDDTARGALARMIKSVSEEITVEQAGTLTQARSLLGGSVSFDLFFLDIHLEPEIEDDTSGIVFAEEIRSREQYTFKPIVMITSVAALEMDAYRRLHCYQYIVKPYQSEEVTDVVKKALLYMHFEEVPSIIVKKNGINFKINCSEIVYCKAIPRGVCLYLVDEVLEVPYLTVHKLLEKLPNKTFFQCHRMFVVNLQKIKYFDLVNRVIKVEGYDEIIDIGVTFKDKARRLLHA